MAATYRCQDGDMLDSICFAYYGKSSGVVEQVLEANPQLADLGPVFSAGQEIILPDLPADPAVQSVSLWD